MGNCLRLPESTACLRRPKQSTPAGDCCNCHGLPLPDGDRKSISLEGMPTWGCRTEDRTKKALEADLWPKLRSPEETRIAKKLSTIVDGEEIFSAPATTSLDNDLIINQVFELLYNNSSVKEFLNLRAVCSRWNALVESSLTLRLVAGVERTKGNKIYSCETRAQFHWRRLRQTVISTKRLQFELIAYHRSRTIDVAARFGSHFLEPTIVSLTFFSRIRNVEIRIESLLRKNFLLRLNDVIKQLQWEVSLRLIIDLSVMESNRICADMCIAIDSAPNRFAAHYPELRMLSVEVIGYISKCANPASVSDELSKFLKYFIEDNDKLLSFSCADSFVRRLLFDIDLQLPKGIITVGGCDIDLYLDWQYSPPAELPDERLFLDSKCLQLTPAASSITLLIITQSSRLELKVLQEFVALTMLDVTILKIDEIVANSSDPPPLKLLRDFTISYRQRKATADDVERMLFEEPGLFLGFDQLLTLGKLTGRLRLDICSSALFLHVFSDSCVKWENLSALKICFSYGFKAPVLDCINLVCATMGRNFSSVTELCFDRSEKSESKVFCWSMLRNLPASVLAFKENILCDDEEDEILEFDEATSTFACKAVSSEDRLEEIFEAVSRTNLCLLETKTALSRENLDTALNGCRETPWTCARSRKLFTTVSKEHCSVKWKAANVHGELIWRTVKIPLYKPKM